MGVSQLRRDSYKLPARARDCGIKIITTQQY